MKGFDVTGLLRFIRAPVFFLGLLFSAIAAFVICAAVSVGSWCEDALRWLGYRSRPAWLPPVLGIIGYVGLGVAGPAYLGGSLIGWPGAVLGPLLMLGLIAVLGRW
jgi:hypothetical protein